MAEHRKYRSEGSVAPPTVRLIRPAGARDLSSELPLRARKILHVRGRPHWNFLPLSAGARRNAPDLEHGAEGLRSQEPQREVRPRDALVIVEVIGELEEELELARLRVAVG